MADPQVKASGSPGVEDALAFLLTRAQAILNEVAEFEAFLSAQQIEVDIGSFKRDLKGEKDSLEKSGRLLPADTTTIECVANRIDSSNIPWYEALWAVAKQQHHVTALRRRMFRSSLQGDGLKERVKGQQAPKEGRVHPPKGKQNVLVDIIAMGGLEWIKVSTITHKRVLFELAKEGWNAQDSASESDWDDSNNECSKSRVGVADLKLVKLALDMKQAARCVRVRYRHPGIRFILTNITEGVADEVDAMIAGIRATGATVECCASGDYHSEDVLALNRLSLEKHALDHPLHLDTMSAFRQMLPIASGIQLTSAINIDCTILLSLISDISHVLREDLRLTTTARYCADVLRQIEVDAMSPLLLNDLYPVLTGRDLVCTTEAVRRMREIVETMGTHCEKMRANIFFANGPLVGRSSDQLRTDLRAYTAHTVPEALRLPIKAVDFDVDAVLKGYAPAKHLPVVIADNVVHTKLRLSLVNKSMFLYGWDAGIVTLTGNRAATCQIERAINEALDEAEMLSAIPSIPHPVSLEKPTSEPVTTQPSACETVSLANDTVLGPKFWFSTPRSLIGKDKGKEGGIDHLNASRRAWEKWVAV